MYISFWIPLAVLAVALAIRLPGIIKLWQDPLLRAVGGLLLLACAVFVFAAPDTIAWTNRVTGVPNISAPVVYTLLTAFCGSCLLLVIAWRNGLSEHSPRTRRATRWVLALYTGVIVALWALFALADVPDERVRDLDTYYARTAFMREEILLYLLAHTAACLVTSRVIWNWIRTGGLGPWLRGGLRFMGVGYAMNLLYDGAKLSAVLARWTGHDLDWLSTDLAPPVACVVLATVESTLAPTVALVEEEARRAGRPADVRTFLVDGAFARFEAGDTHGCARLVAKAADAVTDADVIVLAQASMAPAQHLTTTAVPVLASPRPGLAAGADALHRR
ncbi:hypothetical protein [Streptomyces sp. NPDC005568]|uniref:hypothetical protein n=1 Tax=Streptomyces sp. NPDC005568 TaxID=3156887 RepID=UPI00339E2478